MTSIVGDMTTELHIPTGFHLAAFIGIILVIVIIFTIISAIFQRRI
jgi:uncharacterized membrane protein YhdT